MYEITDDKLSQIQKKIIRLFNRARATIGNKASFDELNIIDKSKKLYEDLEKNNEEIYLEIAKEYYKEINPKGTLDKKWLKTLLLSYCAVTGYVYLNEVERKRARFSESIIATLKSGGTKNKQIETAKNLWWKQTSQYGIEVTDEAMIQGYKDIGVKKLMWITQEDSKVCEVCKSRHKKIYSINNLPTKPHYNCRCYYIPAEVKND